MYVCICKVATVWSQPINWSKGLGKFDLAYSKIGKGFLILKYPHFLQVNVHHGLVS